MQNDWSDTRRQPAARGSAADDDVWAGLMSLRQVDRRVGLSWLSMLGFNPAAPAELLISLLDVGETGFLFRDDLPPGVMDAAVVHPARRVRSAASETDRLSSDQWERLIAASPESGLHGFMIERAAEIRSRRLLSRGARGVGLAPYADAVPPGTPDEIAAMAAAVEDIDPEGRTTALWWIAALHGDADAMRQLADSPKLPVRRSVARAPRLPEDVAALLARDEDRAVRLFLAESCDDAPPEMLLEVAAWWDGSFSFPGRPRNHPNFPREGLLRFAGDPNPRLRALALDDPASTSALVDRFSRDPDAIVRRAAAEDRRLAPGTGVTLAADPDLGVRWRACRNPVLPPDGLLALLLDARSAEWAVVNPAIPIPVMRHLVEIAIPLVEAPAPGRR